MTMATYSKYSPIKYTSAFIGSGNRNLTSTPTTPTWVGPGAYPDMYKPLNSPGGVFDHRARGLGGKIEQTDSREVGTGLKMFSEENTAGIHFKLAGIERDSRSKLLLAKIYPRLASRVYRQKKS